MSSVKVAPEGKEPVAVPPTQLRTRSRRLAWMAVLYVAGGYWIYQSSQATWWVFSLPKTTVMPALGTSVSNVSAHAALTPAWLVSQGVLPSVMGYCQPVSLALIACVIGAGAVLVRSSFVGIIALFVDLLAWHALGACVVAVQGTSGLVSQTTGIGTFATALGCTAVLGVGITVQLAWVNHRLRVERKEAAKAAGEPVPVSFWDIAHNLISPRLASIVPGGDDAGAHSANAHNTNVH